MAPAPTTIERLRVTGRAVTCRRSCVREPVRVTFSASRRVPVAVRVERRRCAPRCAWVLRRRSTLMARPGGNAAPLRFGTRAAAVALGRWRVVVEAPGRPRRSAAFTVRAVHSA